jgi:hypothetical protein
MERTELRCCSKETSGTSLKSKISNAYEDEANVASPPWDSTYHVTHLETKVLRTSRSISTNLTDSRHEIRLLKLPKTNLCCLKFVLKAINLEEVSRG